MPIEKVLTPGGRLTPRTADGTSIVTNSADNGIRLFVVYV